MLIAFRRFEQVCVSVCVRSVPVTQRRSRTRHKQEPEYAGITFPKTRPRFFNSKKAEAVEDPVGGHGVHGAGGTAVVVDGDEARAIPAQALPS